MDKQLNVSVADLYALREFLVRHYATKDSKFSLPNQGSIKEIIGRDHYLFTHVHDDNENLGFRLRRAKLFAFYDLVDFVYLNESIQVQKRDIKDEFDTKTVAELVDVLGTRCHSSMISNLDQLAR